MAGVAPPGQEGAHILPAILNPIGLMWAPTQVDVFVNGQLVPFSMKIGEAGEAFFVFETEEEIPESLVTSPILEATKPGETNARSQETGRFGAGPASPPVKDSAGSSQEPDFLDLNATADGQSREGTPSPPSHSRRSSQDGKSGPGILSRTAQLGKAMIGIAKETERAEMDKLKDKTVLEALKQTEQDEREFLQDKASAAPSIRFPTAEKGDEILPAGEREQVHEPDVRYTDSESRPSSTLEHSLNVRWKAWSSMSKDTIQMPMGVKLQMRH